MRLNRRLLLLLVLLVLLVFLLMLLLRVTPKDGKRRSSPLTRHGLTLAHSVVGSSAAVHIGIHRIVKEQGGSLLQEREGQLQEQRTVSTTAMQQTNTDPFFLLLVSFFSAADVFLKL
jgi:hypothetical protein